MLSPPNLFCHPERSGRGLPQWSVAVLLTAILAAPCPAATTGKTSPLNLPAATEPAAIQVATGFKVELLYTVPKSEQGSWVSLAVDPKGRLIAGDQYGGIYRITVPPIGQSGGATAQLISANIGGAHGLLHTSDSLYVMVNERPEKGLWRLRNTDGDDQFDGVKLLREIKGGGEHGPHSLVPAPDGRSIYFAHGNMSALSAPWEKSRAVAWGEDHLLPRMWDARGHAKDVYAPGGSIGRVDPGSGVAELFAIGFRNQFDLAFDQNGELFTYDSDMEWDQGTPWYVPTRIVHAVDGGDFGWRSGAGRWPAYYADSLPATIDIGPGSPTGIAFGTGAKFPARYQRALFAADWTFGTLYAIHLTAEGASFRGEKEEFLSAKPLPLTDVVINPRDGAMYFAVGGRRTQSALYRVTYAGKENTAAAKIPPPTRAARLRRSLEALHADGAGPEAIDTAWPHLANPDRFIRFAARVAIEKQPAERWTERVFAERRPWAAIEALIALARVGDKSLQPRLLEALGRLDFTRLRADQRLPLLRAWQLAFTRMGKPSPEVCAQLAEKFDPLFPHSDAFVNRELVQLLVYLDSPAVVAKTVPLLVIAEAPSPEPATASLLARNDRYGLTIQAGSEARPDRQQIAYACALRNATAGWTPRLRTEYFSWFPRTQNWRGGSSFSGFIRNIRTEALARTVTDPAERAAIDAQSKIPAPAPVARVVAPKGPGRAYTIDEAVGLAEGRMNGRNFAQGRAMFTAAACSACHRFNGENIGVGPDLSGAGSRYSVRDLLENIIEPSRVISDQYGSEQFERKDGSIVVGRVVAAENNSLLLMTNPFAPDDQARLNLADLKTRQPFEISMMPPGLINALNEEELRDLLAYILSGGNRRDRMFR